MSKSIYHGNGVFNPPPSDDRCECCGRYISELKPYGGPGDPLVGDFSEAYLVRRFRPFGPYNEEAERALAEASECCENEGPETIEKWLINKYGKEKTDNFYSAIEANNLIGKSWECRDCAILHEDEYFEKRKETGKI